MRPKTQFKKPQFTKPQGSLSRERGSREHGAREQGPHGSQAKPNTFKPLVVWGKHVVESFLEKVTRQKTQSKSPYLLHILIDKSGKIPSQLAYTCDMAQNVGIKVITHRSENQGWPLADVHEDIVHQRICLEVPFYPTEDISLASEIVKELNEKKQFGCAGIVLDQVQDPRNFGAILRSAAFFGIKFVIYAENRQASISPLVLKASAGGAFDVNLIPVVNINRALEELKQAGGWILGTANTPQATLLEALPTDRVWVCVLGNEGTGLRAEILKNCDFVTKISKQSSALTLDSLNVSVAAGIILHSLVALPHEQEPNGGQK